jgi:hypothetical protein
MDADSLRRYCAELDLEWPATRDEVREAHRALLQVWHPDKHQHKPKLRKKAEAKLKRVNVATDALLTYIAVGCPVCSACDEPTDEGADLCAACARAAESATDQPNHRPREADKREVDERADAPAEDQRDDPEDADKPVGPSSPWAARPNPRRSRGAWVVYVAGVAIMFFVVRELVTKAAAPAPQRGAASPDPLVNASLPTIWRDWTLGPATVGMPGTPTSEALGNTFTQMGQARAEALMSRHNGATYAVITHTYPTLAGANVKAALEQTAAWCAGHFNGTFDAPTGTSHSAMWFSGSNGSPMHAVVAMTGPVLTCAVSVGATDHDATVFLASARFK